MKVLLINPSSRGAVDSHLPDAITSSIGCYPPLGTLYLATSLKSRLDCQLKILDLAQQDMEYEELARETAAFQPDLIGVSARTYQYYNAITIARTAKTAAPGAHLCVGGPHVNIYPRETLANEFVDSVIMGEAEYSFPEMAVRLSAGANLRGIPGLLYKEAGAIVANGPAEIIADLDSLPMPDRTLLDYRKYFRLLSKERFSTTLISSRGCPSSCTFCDVQYKKWRPRSAEKVLEEMQYCYDLGITDFFFVDDNFNLDMDRVKRICRGILDRKMKLVWSFRGRVDRIDDELLELAKKSGCDNIQYGVESGNGRILELMKKNITPEKALRAFALTRKHGIHSVAYFMIGMPGETRAEILETIDFALKLQADIAHFTIALPYPHTGVYLDGLASGQYKKDFWHDFAISPVPGFTTPVCATEVSHDEISDLYKLATRKFYLRPSFIIKELLALTSFKEFRRKAGAGLSLIADVVRARRL